MRTGKAARLQALQMLLTLVSVLVLAVGLAACSGGGGHAGGDKAVLSADVDKASRAVTITANDANASASVTASLVIEEGECLVVKAELEAGSLGFVLEKDATTYLDTWEFAEGEECYLIDPGTYDLTVTPQEDEAAKGTLVLTPWSTEALAADQERSHLLDDAFPTGPESATEVGMVGGWEPNAIESGTLCTEEQLDLFADAVAQAGTQGLGWTLNPVALLATKTAGDGTVERYGYLVQASIDESSDWAVLVVNMLGDETTPGPTVALSTLDMADLQLSEEWLGVGVDEGWQMVAVPFDAPSVLSEEPQKAFDALEATDEGATDVALAVLGSQVVAGTNYRYLVETVPADGGSPTLSVVEVYHDLDGASSVTSRSYLNLMGYLI